jgi:hypothetical protein
MIFDKPFHLTWTVQTSSDYWIPIEVVKRPITPTSTHLQERENAAIDFLARGKC